MKKVLLFSLLLISTRIFAEDLSHRLLPLTSSITVAPTFTTMNYTYVPEYMKQEKEIVAFIDTNMDTLRVEIAQGKGEHLDTLESYLRPAHPQKWRAYLQDNFEKVFGSEKQLYTAQKVFNKMKDIVSENFERKRI